jgi:hypothetical protein
MNELLQITQGYTRRRHWEIVYHDLLDLYAPMIGLDGIGLWLTYRRYVQHDPDHVLTDRAWPSHRGLAGRLDYCGRKRLHSLRQRLERAHLITVKTGKVLTDETGLELSQLAQLGIQNPASTLFIKVHDPLELDAFCDQFGFRYRPQRTRLGRWDMVFEEYTGRIIGSNRLLAAISYIEEHLEEVTADQIRSLLRCSPSDQQTIAVRARLLNRHRDVVPAAPQRQHSTLPDQALSILARLGWQGDLEEVEEAFSEDRTFVWEQLDYWLEHRQEVDNPAAALRKSLRFGPNEVSYDELQELDF